MASSSQRSQALAIVQMATESMAQTNRGSNESQQPCNSSQRNRVTEGLDTAYPGLVPPDLQTPEHPRSNGVSR